jgi:hypothetical protein
MRVLLLTTPLAPPGAAPANGATLAAVDLARALAAGGLARPILLTRGDVAVPEGCERFAIASDRARDLEVLAAIVRARADVVHAMFAPRAETGVALAAMARLARVPIVQTIASRPRSFARPALALPGRVVVATSRATADALREAGLPDARVVEIPLPFTPPRDVSPPPDRVPGPTLLFAGDYEFGDALAPTLDAFGQLAPPRGMRPTLLIAARAKTRRARTIEAALRARIAETGLRARVLGEVPSLLPWILASSAVLLPARDLYAKLDHPRVLLEALSLGVPIVVGGAPSLAELVREGGEGEHGIGAIAPDVPSLREATETALIREPFDPSRVLPVLARRRAEVVAAAYRALYARVIAGA